MATEINRSLEKDADVPPTQLVAENCAVLVLEGMTCASCAMEASDITLVKGNLKSVATALALSRATMRIIKQNLFWAFAYNSVLIPVAILSPLVPVLRENAPIFAAAAMALSSVTVVTNSLRLRRFGK